MSRNGSGVYNLPPLNPVVAGTTISSTWANNTMNDIASALTDSVAADGQTPMTGNLDLNSNKITNLANATLSTDAVAYGQVSGLITVGTSILKGSGSGGISNATAGTDYCAATTGSSVLKGASGNTTAAIAGTDFVAPNGALGTPSSGTLTNCTVDGTNSVGYRNVPKSGSDKTASYILATSDVGKFIGVGSSGSITIPDATFAAGDIVSLFNNTSGNITITCSITTAYIAGTDSDKATMTLSTRGVATVLFISGTVCVVSGNVS
jgi:hypothetical protein